ncbi:helix-turn-helix domain-containing protein [Salarchaeum sp. JOR-1]|uniref:helix-turn-helix domain-containing protein n=1 Tax=Salarchaeum sp. JOR-1 TaxID=2599399 RepID=UPI0011984107|nr:helix-turn-helix domain-containing protein [Salarchaeum sp. JOR-1]QDX39368.1 helix-turn-helix domain-containing protein [Salarchaeum sp. JOR-1]
MIDVALNMRQYDCPFIDTTDDHGIAFAASHWEFNPHAEHLETRMVVEGDDRGELDSGLSALRDHQHMQSFDLLAKRDGAAQIRTVIEKTDAMDTIRRNDGYITGPFHIRDGRETWRVGFDSTSVADDTLAALERDNEFRVESREDTSLFEMTDIMQNAGAAMTLVNGCRDLSETERRTLESAVQGGYFESPRSATLGDLADEFDVSKPAASKNLRRAERKMVERVVTALDDLE